MPTPTPNSRTPSQLATLWSFRAQRATALQTAGIFHVNPARLRDPTPVPVPWLNPATGRYIL